MEEGDKINMGAQQELSEINIAGTTTHPILPPAEWIEEVNSSNEYGSEECFSTIRLDWCSQHDIPRQLCFVMPDNCSDVNQNHSESNTEQNEQKHLFAVLSIKSPDKSVLSGN